MTIMRQIKIPKLTDPDLAYETGVHIGDGSMQIILSKHDYRVTYWGSVEEFDYYDIILKNVLMKLYDLRNIAVKKVSAERTIYLRICSKQLVFFKRGILGLPCGKKHIMKGLPEFVKTSKRLLKECISGLFDADGTLKFVRKRDKHDYPQIRLDLANENLAKDINDQLKILGFQTVFYFRNRFDSRNRKYYSLWSIDLNGRRMLERWMKEIGFRNNIHLTKYEIWKEYGFCSPKTTLQQRLKILDKSI